MGVVSRSYPCRFDPAFFILFYSGLVPDAALVWKSKEGA